MSKFTCLVLCVVAATLSNIEVTRGESLRDSLRPVIVECAKKHGVTDADIQAAKDAGKAASIPSCFIKCVFETAGLINKKGEYDAEAFSKSLNSLVKDPEQLKKLLDVTQQCSSVKDAPVADDCELGAKVADCFLSHQTSILI